ncbi:immunity protein YezG family protein [Paenibacillus sp. FSL R7-0331]|uniref:immunity protein YezG family protein n=1 Tax=Paenibacillus sp. FSL R7-0331 TaxID=1536773 RepID=UPI0004F842B8|nr:immunity protein YezG family protein [Paenibacillus sp. FSL R7-0331]AIQ53419.1 hypothetical protein R70331_19010 [Paenibacillus sp. FSL R7-0331]
MPTNNIEQLYQFIATKLVEIIPDDWSKIYLYAESLSDSRTIYFYYQSESLDKLIYSHNIPSTYGVDWDIYTELLDELGKYFVTLQEEYKKISSEVWHSVTMHLESTGKFGIDFDYEGKYLLGPDFQQVVWKYENLGIYPTDDYYIEKIDVYLKSKSDHQQS